MFKISLRTSLLLTTALFLVTACDQKSDEQQDNALEQNPTLGTSQHDDAVPATLSGNFLAGQFAQNQSDWSHASDYFATVLDETPNDPSIQRRVMALDMGSGHYDKAITLAKKISKEQTGDTTLAHLLSALSSFKDGKYHDAQMEIETHSNDGLGVAILPLLQAWTDAGQGKTNIASLKDSPSMVYQSVLIAGYTKNKAVIADLAKAYDFTKTPTPISRLEDIADVFSYFGEKDEARDILNTLKSSIPARAAIYNDKLKMIDSPISTAPPQQISTPQIALSEALFDMARLLSNGYADSAQLFAHMALYMNPENDSALEILAQIAADNKLYKESIAYLSRIDTSHSPDKAVQIGMQTAQFMTESGQSSEAVRILEAIVETHKNVDAQIKIGDIYRNDEKYDDALKAYDAAFALLDNKITAKYWDLSFVRGMVNERLKNWEQAEKDLKTALLYEPDQPYVLNYLGYSWADQGLNLDKAAEMIEKAVRMKPDDGAIVDSLGWVYFRMGKFDKAVETLEKAVELSPTETEINDHLGDAYWRVGRKSEARFQWKRAVSFSKDAKITSDIKTKIEDGLADISSPPAAEKLTKKK